MRARPGNRRCSLLRHLAPHPAAKALPSQTPAFACSLHPQFSAPKAGGPAGEALQKRATKQGGDRPTRLWDRTRRLVGEKPRKCEGKYPSMGGSARPRGRDSPGAATHRRRPRPANVTAAGQAPFLPTAVSGPPRSPECPRDAAGPLLPRGDANICWSSMSLLPTLPKECCLTAIGLCAGNPIAPLAGLPKERVLYCIRCPARDPGGRPLRAFVSTVVTMRRQAPGGALDQERSDGAMRHQHATPRGRGRG